VCRDAVLVASRAAAGHILVAAPACLTGDLHFPQQRSQIAIAQPTPPECTLYMLRVWIPRITARELTTLFVFPLETRVLLEKSHIPQWQCEKTQNTPFPNF
jgi:hypothetical protein